MAAGLTGYFLGRTPTFACQADPRFSYCLYVPPEHAERGRARILVAVHDTLRNHQAMREAFVEYAEEANTLVLAPLFPAGIEVAEDLDNYKYLLFRGTRFDHVLLDMVREVAARYVLDGSLFSLFGFSGGAHFAHRFLYVHPDRLSALVAGSPGSVTLPTTEHRWWPGLANFESVFGQRVDWERLRKVPIHLVVGENDVNPRGIVGSRDHANWVEGANVAGANRIERLRSLHSEFVRCGARATFEALPGVAHEFAPIAQAAVRFLRANVSTAAAA